MKDKVLIFGPIQRIIMVGKEVRQMCSQQQLTGIIERLIGDAKAIFGDSIHEVILYGSYARQDADDESDIDIMVLLDLPREQLPVYRRSLAEISGNLLFEFGVVVSPVLESKAFFERNRETYPFFRNVDQEGVRYAS